MILFPIVMISLMLLVIGYNFYARKRFEKRYRAHYTDGTRSRPMNYYVARNYAEIFGGEVEKDESLDPYGYPKTTTD